MNATRRPGSRGGVQPESTKAPGGTIVSGAVEGGDGRNPSGESRMRVRPGGTAHRLQSGVLGGRGRSGFRSLRVREELAPLQQGDVVFVAEVRVQADAE